MIVNKNNYYLFIFLFILYDSSIIQLHLSLFERFA